MSKVLIGTHKFDQGDVLDNLAHYKDELERARSQKLTVKCLCNANEPLLSIRSVKAGFILARWPLTGPTHNKAICRFHSPDSESASHSARAKKAFISTEKGLDIKLDVPITVTIGPITPREGGDHSGGSGTSQTREAAGILAFLEFIWEQAGLHKWRDQDRRNWGSCYSLLSGALGDGTINGKPMSEVLHIMEPFNQAQSRQIDARLDSFIRGIGDTGQTDRRGLVVGEIKEFQHEKGPDKKSIRILLKNSKIGNIFISSALYKRVVQSHNVALTSVGKPGRKVVAILFIKLKQSGFANVIDMAALLTNDVYVPCESSYELAMADRLVAAKRFFTKPLRHLDNAPVHPDFVFDDVNNPTVIEVYGMEGHEDYDARAEEKRIHYRENKILCIEWFPSQIAVEDVQLPT